MKYRSRAYQLRKVGQSLWIIHKIGSNIGSTLKNPQYWDLSNEEATDFPFKLPEVLSTALK